MTPANQHTSTPSSDEASAKSDSPLIKRRPAEAEKPVEKTVTEKLMENTPDNMKWVFIFTLPASKYFMLSIEHEWDYQQRNWHFIARKINEEYQSEHDGHKAIFDILCIDDKASRKRLEKFLRKYLPLGTAIIWKDINEEPK